jgi:hypothetical protein
MRGVFPTPVVSHPSLPEGVPLVASFHDDRNRLSYYNPILQQTEDVRTPITTFVQVTGDADTFLDVEYRDITQFMQDIGVTEAFVRSDFSSGKFDGDAGSRIESQDPHDIEETVLELFTQLSLGKRRIGGRIAIREWLPHDAEVRYFIRDGGILYRDTLDEVSDSEFPDEMAENVATAFDTFAWSADFIRHETTEKWYAIDMGLDGLYPTGNEWIAISEHLDEDYSPQRHADEMPDANRFRYRR